MASRSVESTAQRLAGIVEAAEQAASKVIDDAEEQARRRLEEAEAEAERLVSERLAALSRLTDSLIEQSEAIRQRSDRLLSSLEEARELIGDGRTGSPAPPKDGDAPARNSSDSDAPSRGSHLIAVAPVEDGEDEERRVEPGSAAGARLLATQMAVSGSSREEIAARLRNGFEIEDTAPILDAILGPEE